MSDRTDVALLAEEMVAWLREQAAIAGVSRLVLGLSGGIDSAVVCALAARAVGPSAVVAAILPVHSRAEDLRDADLVAAKFEVVPQTIDLAPAYEAFIAAMPGAAEAPALALANVKPRLRMTALYYLANQQHGLVVGTGNRTELAIGYFTKYGDGGVDLLPLGDLDKTTVRGLARELGVPEPIIAKAPSAGLWEGQTDEAEIGLTYDLLDATLAALADGRPEAADDEARRRVGALIAASEHKRRPAPIFRHTSPALSS